MVSEVSEVAWPGRGEAGGEAGVNFFRGERCGWFRRGKGYGRATLVADQRHAVR